MLKSKFTVAGSKNVFRPRFPRKNPVSGSRTVGERKHVGLKACWKSPGEIPLRASAHSRDPDLRHRIDVLHGAAPPPGLTMDAVAMQRNYDSGWGFVFGEQFRAAIERPRVE
jgi:hypothetical protein